jgi:hypothetical protein
MKTRLYLSALILILTAVLIAACGTPGAPMQGAEAASQLPAPRGGGSEGNSSGSQPPAGMAVMPSGPEGDQPPFDLAQAPEGTMALMVYSESRTADPLTFAVEAGKGFEGEFAFGNLSGSEMDFVLLCLVDYVQTPCASDEGETTQRFALKNREQERGRLALKPLAAGLHDLVLVVFFQPDNHSVDERFRQDSRFMYIFRRVNLLVGDSRQPPAVEYRAFDEPDTFAKQGMNVLALTQEKIAEPWASPWLRSTLSAGQATPFNVWVNNVQQTPARLAVVALLDYEQVALTDKGPVLYGELAGQSRADIAGSVAPGKAGQQEFLVLLIENPYIDLAEQAQKREPLPFFVTSSGRVMVESE